jgi:predicted porin
MEGEILGAAVNSDIVKYYSPSFGGVVLSGSLTEAVGLGNGLSTGQSRALTVGADYAAGPIAAKIDYSSWKNNAVADSRYRIAGSYDLGVVKLGAGYQDMKKVAAVGGHDKEAILGVSAPLGPVTVGAVYVRNDDAGVKNTGYSFGASYALSKRTSVIANYTSWEQLGAVTAGDKSKKTWIVLDHTF